VIKAEKMQDSVNNQQLQFLRWIAAISGSLRQGDGNANREIAEVASGGIRRAFAAGECQHVRWAVGAEEGGVQVLHVIGSGEQNGQAPGIRRLVLQGGPGGTR